MTELAKLGRRGVTAVVLAAATASAAEAQIADSFEQLRLLVGQDDRITVTDRSGQELTGSITDVSPSSLTLLVHDTPHVFDAADVGAIRQRRSDSIRNGARNGFWTGVGILGGTFAIAHYTTDGDSPDFGAWIWVLTSGGIQGALVGAIVDDKIQEQRVIYRATGAARRLTVSPLLSRGRRGVAVSLGF